jgi:hypothetical protein
MMHAPTPGCYDVDAALMSLELRWGCMNAPCVWLLRIEQAGGILRPWRHLPLRCTAPGPDGGSPGPGRCDSDPVLTGTMWHCPGCGAVARAAAVWREGCRGRRGGPGCARSRRRPALPSPAGNSLQKSHTHAAFTPYALERVVPQ